MVYVAVHIKPCPFPPNDKHVFVFSIRCILLTKTLGEEAAFLLHVCMACSTIRPWSLNYPLSTTVRKIINHNKQYCERESCILSSFMSCTLRLKAGYMGDSERQRKADGKALWIRKIHSTSSFTVIFRRRTKKRKLVWKNDSNRETIGAHSILFSVEISPCKWILFTISAIDECKNRLIDS